MISIRHLGRFASLSFLTLALVGCEAPVTPPAADKPATTTEAPGSNDIKSMPVEPKAGAANDVKLSDDEIAEIKKLPAEEQTIVLAQKVCPVSGGHLGSMDAPIKQVVDGKTFYLCCSGCEDKVKSDPAAVLAKLPK